MTLLTTALEMYEDALLISQIDKSSKIEMFNLMDKVDVIETFITQVINNNPDRAKDIISEINRGLDIVSLRMSFLLATSNFRGEILLIPNTRDYMFMGETIWTDTMEHLSNYKSVSDTATLMEMQNRIITGLSKANIQQETMLEFRLMIVLVLLLRIFEADKTNIGFIATLFRDQDRLFKR